MKARNKLVSFMIVLSCTLIITSHLGAATFTVGSASGSPGDKDILIPIDLSSETGEEACSFNFDLNFCTSRLSFKEVTLGPRATEAGKSLSYRRKSSNTVSVIVIGFNQKAIENGTVLNFTFDILSSAPSGKAELTITDPSVADLGAHHVPVHTEKGSITVDGNPPDSTTTTSTNTPTTVITTTSTTIQPPLPDSTTTTSTSDMSPSSTTSLNPTSSTTTISASQLWPLLYDEMWGNRKDRNLLLLRAFRDEILVNTEVGREYIFMLYGNSLEIVILLLQEPSLTSQTKGVIDELLISVESLLYNDEIEISQDTIKNFESLLDQFEGKASPELRTAIKKLKRDIRKERTFKQLGISIVK